MKILWIVNILMGPLSEKLTGKRNGGLWMDALLSGFKNKSDVEIVIATAYKTKNTICAEEDGVKYYALPDNYVIYYNENKKKNLKAWKELIERENPDVIHIFGTEFTHGLCALKVKGDIPAVIHLQGIMESIARFYQAGIPYKELKKTLTFRDIIRRDGILAQQKKFYKAAEKEKESIKLACNVISENEWANAYVKSFYPNVKIYTRAESLNPIFKTVQWDMEKAERKSIMCTASGYTIKGLHIMLRALALLKIKYSDVKLYVPGTPQVSGKGIKERLRRSGYVKYIDNLIGKLNVRDNIVWLNNISQKELAEYYKRVNVFVLCSAIENHSNSLKEALTVGTPCVASAVGGITSYATDGENALLYRFEEYEVLADKISLIFDNDDLAKSLSENARNSLQKLHDEKDIADKTLKIYKDLFVKGAGAE